MEVRANCYKPVRRIPNLQDSSTHFEIMDMNLEHSNDDEEFTSLLLVSEEELRRAAYKEKQRAQA